MISLPSRLGEIPKKSYINTQPCVENLIGTQQFGCLRGSSTVYCLRDMIHNWLSLLDSPDRHIRLLFLDNLRLSTVLDITFLSTNSSTWELGAV